MDTVNVAIAAYCSLRSCTTHPNPWPEEEPMTPQADLGAPAQVTCYQGDLGGLMLVNGRNGVTGERCALIAGAGACHNYSPRPLAARD